MEIILSIVLSRGAHLATHLSLLFWAKGCCQWRGQTHSTVLLGPRRGKGGARRELLVFFSSLCLSFVFFCLFLFDCFDLLCCLFFVMCWSLCCVHFFICWFDLVAFVGNVRFWEIALVYAILLFLEPFKNVAFSVISSSFALS